MNFSIHVDQVLQKDLDILVKKSGKARNALITEALRFFIQSQKQSKWPRAVLKLAGADKNREPFESLRRELSQPSDDPLS